jgi:hypothetical protein
VDALRTVTSYFDKGWNAFAQQTDGSIQWIPEQIVGIVMPQLHQMISGLQMPKITYVHTAQRETISIREALEKAVIPEKMKLILKARTQMVESIYKYFDLDLSESHRAKLYICTLLDPRFKKFNFWPTRKYVDNSQLCTECI